MANVEMIRAGLAKEAFYGDNAKDYLTVQDEAKAAGRGVWHVDPPPTTVKPAPPTTSPRVTTTPSSRRRARSRRLPAYQRAKAALRTSHREPRMS
jgi:hypothetical protein